MQDITERNKSVMGRYEMLRSFEEALPGVEEHYEHYGTLLDVMEVLWIVMEALQNITKL